MAIASLVDDVTHPSQLDYIIARCAQRRERILLNMCREVLPDLVKIDHITEDGRRIADVYYTFAKARFVVRTTLWGGKEELSVRSYENTSREPLTSGAGAVVRAIWQEHYMPCPVSPKQHVSIVARIIKWRKL
jgi:hypothetical protein